MTEELEGKQPGAAGGARRQRGQALVEFGISSIVLILLVTGLIDLSRAFYYDIGIHGAAFSGARHAAWFEFGARQNKYLDNTDIINTVNQSLSGSGLTAVPVYNCPNGQGNSKHNPPYDSSYYPTGYNTVNLYFCYTKPDGTVISSLATPPASYDYTWRGGDINVILLMNYGLVSGYLQSTLNAFGGIHIATNSHFMIQGGY